VANSKIALELSGRKLRITLSFTIRHQHLFEEGPFSLSLNKCSHPPL
jgi:hypothetical protein